MTCGSHAAASITARNAAQRDDDVVRPGERPDEIQVDHALTPVATEQLRRDHGREHEHDDRRDAVVVGVRRQVRLLRRARPAEPVRGAGDDRHHQADHRQHHDEEPGQDLGAPPRPRPSAIRSPSLKTASRARPRPSRAPV